MRSSKFEGRIFAEKENMTKLAGRGEEASGGRTQGQAPEGAGGAGLPTGRAGEGKADLRGLAGDPLSSAVGPQGWGLCLMKPISGPHSSEGHVMHTAYPEIGLGRREYSLMDSSTVVLKFFYLDTGNLDQLCHWSSLKSFPPERQRCLHFLITESRLHCLVLLARPLCALLHCYLCRGCRKR